MGLQRNLLNQDEELGAGEIYNSICEFEPVIALKTKIGRKFIISSLYSQRVVEQRNTNETKNPYQTKP